MRKDAALGGTGADGLRVRDIFPQLHVLSPVRQKVCDPLAGGVRLSELGELSVKRRAEVHKQDPGVGSCRVQMLEGEMGHVNCISYRPVGSVGELQGVQEWVCYGFHVGEHKGLKRLHDHRGEGNRSVVILSCGPCFLGNRDDGG